MKANGKEIGLTWVTKVLAFAPCPTCGEGFIATDEKGAVRESANCLNCMTKIELIDDDMYSINDLFYAEILREGANLFRRDLVKSETEAYEAAIEIIFSRDHPEVTDREPYIRAIKLAFFYKLTGKILKV